jgi:hypothetical protein
LIETGITPPDEADIVQSVALRRQVLSVARKLTPAKSRRNASSGKAFSLVSEK